MHLCFPEPQVLILGRVYFHHHSLPPPPADKHVTVVSLLQVLLQSGVLHDGPLDQQRERARVFRVLRCLYKTLQGLAYVYVCVCVCVRVRTCMCACVQACVFGCKKANGT